MRLEPLNRSPKPRIFSGINFSLPSFFMRSSRAVRKASKAKVRLDCSRLIGDGLLLLLEIGGIGLGFLHHFVDHPVCAEVDRRADLARLQCEGGSELFAAADAGDGAAAGERLGGFGIQAQSFGGRVELFAALDALFEFLGLGFGQLRRPFAASGRQVTFSRTSSSVPWMGGKDLLQVREPRSRDRCEWAGSSSPWRS